MLSTCQSQLQSLLRQQEYDQLIHICELKIEEEPSEISIYWYLGLAHLLKGEETEAQSTWLFATASLDTDNPTELNELIEILESEAQYQLTLEHPGVGWLLRQHIREIQPENLLNLLNLLDLSVSLGEFNSQLLHAWNIHKIIENVPTYSIEKNLLKSVCQKLLSSAQPDCLPLIEASLTHFHLQDWISMIVDAAILTGYYRDQYEYAIQLIELCLAHNPDSLQALEHLARFYSAIYKFPEAIIAANRFSELCERSDDLSLRLAASIFLLKTVLSSGEWEQIPSVHQQNKSLLEDFLKQDSKVLSSGVTQALILNSSMLYYLQDSPAENRAFINKSSNVFFNCFHAEPVPQLHEQNLTEVSEHKRIKIGYIAHTLKEHSVGWLSRWLFQHHNKEEFEIYLYLIGQSETDQFFKKFFAPYAFKINTFEKNHKNIANAIATDDINILVDLDSATLDITCAVMAMKPAPVQITWLGYDASGIPSIDYFLADPYVLPEDAQNYYVEKIWRLPQTYVAVDGFEIDVPTLRREDLGIPADAVIFLSAQVGMKRHPDIIRLQLDILRSTPNSYFLIKGLANQETIQDYFRKLAVECGVNSEKLIFLSRDQTSYTHRANLQIADVILDTYPYNGATTTLEALWVGVPIVTRVGQQFAARNSYGFMMNVGVTEGIAWTDQEYIDWGIRLGQDESLRQDISLRLRASRKTSPLWNAQQFTREIELAYQQMWQGYLASK
jgi:predicted O-linked N-acetylglucosamine transferase (SPINDLY family)